jgi:hypothetical protein
MPEPTPLLLAAGLAMTCCVLIYDDSFCLICFEKSASVASIGFPPTIAINASLVKLLTAASVIKKRGARRVL